MDFELSLKMLLRIMRKKIAFLFLLCSNFIFAQNEQISLNFVAENLLPKIEKVKVFYDGKIIEKTKYEEQNAEETIIENIVWDYQLQGKNRRGLSNQEVDFYRSLNFEEIGKFANVKNSIQNNLEIPKSINFSKILKTNKRRSGKFKLTSQKYNLKVSPSIQLSENIYLTRIFLTKQDFEKGSYFDIIVQNNKVVDWLEIGWIQ
ncbi:hypothetical protein BA768_04935 [Chryseobacterium sp. CBo1]|uniref:hypothetical protein n=1 Tax=Chryseobacterium sp. CBo1 TaxID=1869230 RepID=UPI00081069C3|nr:hypothetical protein [Chryseobacterium sp. CBo1]OCK50500.1 hypothetical protein BA768_04935 [Chryseobacterium sp. CBo1]